MSRKSLLDEAITKAKEAEDWQLVEWLRMARGGESAARWYSDKLREAHRTERKLLDENAKLREELESVGTAAYLYGRSDLKAENAKLRELVWDMMRFFEDGDYCTVCEVERECTANEQYNDDCLMRDVFHDRMHELGIEVDGA